MSNIFAFISHTPTTTTTYGDKRLKTALNVATVRPYTILADAERGRGFLYMIEC